MISYTDALNIIRQTVDQRRLQSEKVRLEKSVGRICSENLTVGLNIPPFDNAAMDGFAVLLSDFPKDAGTDPIVLKKTGIVAAGTSQAIFNIQTGTCQHVMTGAALPQNTDAIVPIEETSFVAESVLFKTPPKMWQHIRRIGEDFLKDSILPLKGSRLQPSHILPLATLGIAHVPVLKKPRVLFVSTGAELIDDLAVPLETGKIYNSNSAYAESFLSACGADVTVQKTIADDLESVTGFLNRVDAEGYDLVISSGAVSAGAFDFIKDGLAHIGAELLYHKIKLKPGKPNLLARLPKGTLYFGLPGNPVATSVGLRFLVMEALMRLQGIRKAPPVYARMMNKFNKKTGLHLILKAKYESWDDGTLSVDIMAGQESFMVHPFLYMNAWVHLNEDIETVKAGDTVELHPLIPETFF